jgi:hypothetical protein
MRVLAAVLLVVGAGYPGAFALTRRFLFSVLVAPMVSAVTAALAVIGMLVTRTSFPAWLVALLAAQYALVAWRLRRRVPGLAHTTWADVLCYALPLAPPALTVLGPAALWDAHSIWWTHAGYFLHGGAFARQDMLSSAYRLAHPDYPPLASAEVAAAWTVVPGYSFTVAQFVSATLNLSAIATLAYSVRTVTARAPVTVSRLAGIAVALAVWGTAPYGVAGGYSDQLWAPALVGAAALLLLGERPMDRPAVPVLLLTVAALTKNEALVPVVLVAALVTLRERRQVLRAWPVWPPVAAGVAWLLLVKTLGVQSDIAPNGFSGLLSGDRAVLGRVPTTAHSLWHTVGVLVLLAVIVALAGAATLRRQRRALGIGSDLWLWGIAAVYTVSLLVVYATSAQEIGWYLLTSIDRVTVPLELLACLSAVCWGTAAFAGLGAEVPVSSPRGTASRTASVARS